MSKDAPSKPKHVGTMNLTFGIYPGDDELIKWIQEKVGGTRSDVVRTGIRLYAQVISQSLGRP